MRRITSQNYAVYEFTVSSQPVQGRLPVQRRTGAGCQRTESRQRSQERRAPAKASGDVYTSRGGDGGAATAQAARHQRQCQFQGQQLVESFPAQRSHERQCGHCQQGQRLVICILCVRVFYCIFVGFISSSFELKAVSTHPVQNFVSVFTTTRLDSDHSSCASGSTTARPDVTQEAGSCRQDERCDDDGVINAAAGASTTQQLAD